TSLGCGTGIVTWSPICSLSGFGMVSAFAAIRSASFTLNFLAIFDMVSPDWTMYSWGVGAGTGVGRKVSAATELSGDGLGLETADGLPNPRRPGSAKRTAAASASATTA